MVKTYMVDYLENVCAHRLEKAMRKDEKEKEERNSFVQPVAPEPVTPGPIPAPEIYPLPEVALPEPVEIKEKVPVSKDVRIREILEEFLA